jgi:hypothetical protein
MRAGVLTHVEFAFPRVPRGKTAHSTWNYQNQQAAYFTAHAHVNIFVMTWYAVSLTYPICFIFPNGKMGSGLLCRNGPKGASHK